MVTVRHDPEADGYWLSYFIIGAYDLEITSQTSTRILGTSLGIDFDFQGSFTQSGLYLTALYISENGNQLASVTNMNWDMIALANETIDFTQLAWDYEGSAAGEVIGGGYYADKLYGLGGDDLIEPLSGVDIIDGGAGVDTVRYLFGLEDRVVVNLGQGFADDGTGSRDTISSIENVLAGEFNDLLIGSGADNTLDGGAGDDSLVGKRGDDTLIGGDGHDNLNGGDGDDLLYGDAESTYSSSTGGDDKIGGRAGNDTLYGHGGNDLLIGQKGDDLLYGGDGDDKMNGGDGVDELVGGDGDDLIIGGAGDDLIDGGDGADRLLGGNGDDRIIGGAGDDIINGAGGADTFVYGTGSWSGAAGYLGDDTIRGFQNGIDQFEISGAVTFDDLVITQVGANTVIEIDLGTSATLLNTNAGSIDESDFIFG
ncbi:MAG: hypothetical protein MRY63_07705 [Neomegalonema sp.]|nr:hypothetical protein [Neomegalonema sp.]